MPDRPVLTRADPFFPQWECHCQYIQRQGGAFNFNWSLASPEMRQDFQKEEEWKQGTLLLACRRCGQRWALSCPRMFVWGVDQKDIEHFRDWHARDLRPSEKMLGILQQIRQAHHLWDGVNLKRVLQSRKDDDILLRNQFPELHWQLSPYNQTELTAAPCRVTFKGGSVCDGAIILFGLPIVTQWAGCRYMDEVAALEPSPLTLPLAIRQKALYAPEVAMGCPILFLKGPSGQRYATDAASVFFRNGNDVGFQMQISEGDFKELEKLPKGEPMETVTILADPA